MLVLPFFPWVGRHSCWLITDGFVVFGNMIFECRAIIHTFDITWVEQGLSHVEPNNHISAASKIAVVCTHVIGPSLNDCTLFLSVMICLPHFDADRGGKFAQFCMSMSHITHNIYSTDAHILQFAATHQCIQHCEIIPAKIHHACCLYLWRKKGCQCSSGWRYNTNRHLCRLICICGMQSTLVVAAAAIFATQPRLRKMSHPHSSSHTSHVGFVMLLCGVVLHGTCHIRIYIWQTSVHPLILCHRQARIHNSVFYAIQHLNDIFQFNATTRTCWINVLQWFCSIDSNIVYRIYDYSLFLLTFVKQWETIPRTPRDVYEHIAYCCLLSDEAVDVVLELMLHFIAIPIDCAENTEKNAVTQNRNKSIKSIEY